jgi:predicted ATPase
MATGILIIGESGTGKSTSIRNLDITKTFVVNVQGKPLPWKMASGDYSEANKNALHSDNMQKVTAILENVSEKAPLIKTIIVDDFQYLMVNEMMRRSKEVGYNKYSDIARGIWDMINSVPHLRDDLTVIFLAHSEVNSLGKEKVKTVGKMLDDQVNIEGMFTVVLKSFCNNGKYLFATKTNGMDTVKSPIGMFETDTIENDLQIVIDAVNNY